jgi:hypothetical protein
MLKNTTVAKFVRDVIAVAFVVSLGVLVIGARLGRLPVDAVFLTFADVLYFVFVLSGGYVVSGQRVIDSAMETYQRLKGDGE